MEINLPQTLQDRVRSSSDTWLVTGAAGFIGVNLVQALLALDQKVIGFDNFDTGKRSNLEAIKQRLSEKQWRCFKFIEGDIRNKALCEQACQSATIVLHQAAIGSVLRSCEQPLESHEVNVTGFIHVLKAAKNNGIKKIVYASSSSVYGDNEDPQKKEDRLGQLLSPYAVTKRSDELYAHVFAELYRLPVVGLRYFNVFGPFQDPHGPYAAVIPCWIQALLTQAPVFINGDGNTTRDFCYIDNVVQANLLAALNEPFSELSPVFNVGLGQSTDLNHLFVVLHRVISNAFPNVKKIKPSYCDFRPGDIRHSVADLQKIKYELKYRPCVDLTEGLVKSLSWYKHVLVS